ncbi:MAG: NADH-quinone oxidoreductase subunit NuoE [Bacillota bacterium]|nr:NADH-quinone oxidoreductase subunit NuoE [Bacillota bacterium]
MCECGCTQPAGDAQKEKELKDLFEKWRGVKGALIPILQGAQAIYGYLPREILIWIARELKLPPSRVFGAATFYAQFHLKPRGRNIVRVCLGTACHVRGGARIFERLQQELGVGNNETTPDLNFTLETVACLGCCGLSPVIMVNDDTHGRLAPDKLKDILANYQ